MTTSAQTWAKQEPLAERWTVVLVDRRGYEPNPVESFSNADVDGDDLVALLESGDHLVGHSYGALGAICAAARRGTELGSLTVIEPPVLSMVRGDPEVEARIEHVTGIRRDVQDPRAFHLAFATMLGAPSDNVPDPLPAALERQVRLLMHERPPWDVVLPIDALRDSGLPVLVVSGGWDPLQEQLCDRFAAAVGAQAERTAVTGRGHVPQRTGAPFNDCLEAFLGRVEARRAPH
jgi:pimeloyl-ACP methyl ester carboxylesterase